MKKESFKYISLFITRAFLIAIFCFILVLGVFSCVYFGDRLLNSNSGKPLFNGYIIVSQSMVPTININDGIIVKRIDNDGYKVGDIISFTSNDDNYKGLTVTHRVIDKDNIKNGDSLYTTKGDNNMLADSKKIDTSEIYGKVLFIIPKIGYINSFLSKPSNIFIIVLSIVGIVLVYYSIGIGESLNKRRS